MKMSLVPLLSFSAKENIFQHLFSSPSCWLSTRDISCSTWKIIPMCSVHIIIMGIPITTINTLGKNTSKQDRKPTSFITQFSLIYNDILMKKLTTYICFTRSFSPFFHCILDYATGKHQDWQGQKEEATENPVLHAKEIKTRDGFSYSRPCSI